MGFKPSDIARVLEALRSEGVKAVVIGDTIPHLLLGTRELDGDLDLFVYEPSPLVDQDFYRELASRRGWEVSSTEIGTVKLIVPLEDGYLSVELYENYMDLEIPGRILEEAVEVEVDGVRVEMLPLEAYLVLKARQGVDLDKLGEYVRKLGRRVNRKLVKELAGEYPEDEYELILDRLREAGLNI